MDQQDMILKIGKLQHLLNNQKETPCILPIAFCQKVTLIMILQIVCMWRLKMMKNIDQSVNKKLQEK